MLTCCLAPSLPRRITPGVLLLALASWLCPAAQSEEWKPLFNEKDLTGWVHVNTPESTWTVQDKMLICSGKPIGEIRTERMFQNFILEVEWRHMVPKGNAGIFVWADDITARGVPFHRGIEVQVLENAYGNTKSHTTHGDIFPIHGATMVPINGRGGSRAFPTEERSNPSPQWNHYRIHCEDGKISLAVNGKMVTQGQECNPRKGYICLESEGGVVHYRNIRIQELPETPVASDQIAVSSRGLTSLYSGLDLAGWTAASPRLWKPNDWVLLCDGTRDDDSTLTSTPTFENFHFVCDFRLLEEGSTFQMQLKKDGPWLSSQDNILQERLEKRGAWNRIEGVVRNGKVELTINHRTPVTMEGLPQTRSSIAFQPKGKVEFANIFAKKMPD